ncbi:hypothetical protein KAR91_21670 [Candidatus Pacearchaeota archaeon]|nr:hypothetical protein [Candidatus Pacearchaeota archaeon]
MSWDKENAEILAIRNRLKSNQPYSRIVADSRYMLNYIDTQHGHIARMIDKLRDMIGEMP